MAATRLYFPPATPPVTPETWLAWGHIGGSPPAVGLASLTKSDSILLGLPGSTDITYGGSVGLIQYVYGPLAAQTISGTVKGQFQGLESTDPANATLAFGVKLITPTGVDRSILLPAPTGQSYLAGRPPEFVSSDVGVETNRRLLDGVGSTPITLTSQTCQEGDYLVIEVGFKFTASLNYGVVIFLGDPSAGDLPEDDLDTSIDLAPWVEFSADIALGTAAPQVTSAAAATASWVVPTAVAFPTTLVVPATAAHATWTVPPALAHVVVVSQIISAASAFITWVVPAATASLGVGAPCCDITYAQAKSALAAKLGDPTKTFWTDQELGDLILDALRTWNAYTDFFRGHAAFTTIAGQMFYDLRDVTPGMIGTTLTTQDLVRRLCEFLIEPTSTTAWVGSSMFTLNDLVNALCRRQRQFLLETGHIIEDTLRESNDPTVVKVE